MPLVVKYCCLLQFADDTYLICQGESPAVVGTHLNADLCLLGSAPVKCILVLKV